MNHVWLAVGTFAAVFVAIQVFVLVATIIVNVCFPEWESAKTRLRVINKRSIQYAMEGSRLIKKYILWVVISVLTLITLIYS